LKCYEAFIICLTDSTAVVVLLRSSYAQRGLRDRNSVRPSVSVSVRHRRAL